MKIFRKIFRNKKKKHIVNQKKRRTTSKARKASRMHDAHLLKDDFLFGTGTRRSRPHRRKHKENDIEAAHRPISTNSGAISSRLLSTKRGVKRHQEVANIRVSNVFFPFQRRTSMTKEL
ncbi:PREDICTED: uncharacterized protein LOC108767554 [Trachymyrmex cornetzi]|uniref:uncharacterized protein LOC108767554 n=1 Tax=Trachymyrmex cornetzi TaxID=471704 RepID=UPI00084F093E|nr:PREDICTED: uncharacterized protein LOC108767554 [Trachymyrmex cornetzi]